MAEFGIEAIRHFSNARAAGYGASDLTYTFNRSNGFRNKLRNAGHTQTFYWTETNCFETDFRDTSQGGHDNDAVDKVDIVWFETHGNNTANGPLMVFDRAQTRWITEGKDWRLGNIDLEWLMAFSCHTVDKSKVSRLWNIFRGLHIYCGAYHNMYDGWTTDECGEDVADNLTDGDTVSESWIDGVSDWYVDNHPITVCPANARVYNNGNIRWNESFLNRDHYWGHGTVLSDPIPSEQVRLLYRWAEG
jgi:hypothetical protein